MDAVAKVMATALFKLFGFGSTTPMAGKFPCSRNQLSAATSGSKSGLTGKSLNN
jgi:hypothetical protein